MKGRNGTLGPSAVEEGGDGRNGLEEMLGELMREIREIREELKRERLERKKLEEEWREAKRRWVQEISEEKARRERLEMRIEKVEDRGEKLEEEMKGIREGVIGDSEGGKGVGGEDGRRLRKLEVRQDLWEREKTRNNMLVRNVEVVEGDVKEEVKGLWGGWG
ncbi:hypothetical protein PV327_007355 [Microctonus hyperodae]|uniref:Uncharacterized protein n=1 Tax=Microctonus hyperodae TaxID=165561 RepID=A0AA39KYI0_MICHY|nr:hypothetical protein PV327_007355 [Microctonus hyperodae]